MFQELCTTQSRWTTCISRYSIRAHTNFSLHVSWPITQISITLSGSAIEASLKQLAERRTDIFGVGDEETAIGKKIGEEDKKEDKVSCLT